MVQSTHRVCQGCNEALSGQARKWCSGTCRSRVLRRDPEFVARERVAARDYARAKRVARGPLTHDLLCEHCGTGFVGSRSDRKYCSERCSRRAYSERRIADGRLAAQRKKHADKKAEWLRDNRNRLSHRYREQRVCAACGEQYTVRKGEPTRTCGASVCVYFIQTGSWPSSEVRQPKPRPRGPQPSRWGDLRAGYEKGDWPRVADAIESRATKKPDGCWEWAGDRSKKYGKVLIGGNQIAAHRLALMAKLGADLGSQAAHHICANTLCVNPDHLQPVTHRENVAEMLARQSYLARIRELEAALGEASPGHPLLGVVPVL